MSLQDLDGEDRGEAFAHAALDNWQHRFIANGVNPGDFEAMYSKMDTWGDWCGVFREVGEGRKALGEAALEEGESETAGVHLTEAAMHFHYGSFVWHEDDDVRDALHRDAISTFAEGSRHIDPPVDRIEAPSGRGFDVPGLLRVPDAGPDGEPGDSPVVFLHPGLDSVKEEVSLAFGDYLHSRGLATLAVDGPGQGETWYDHEMSPDFAEMVSPLLDRLEALDPAGVDVSSVGTMGTSLGGFYAPLLAATDDRFGACVGLAGPFTVGPVTPERDVIHREQFLWACKADDLDGVNGITEAMTLEGRIDDLTCPSLMVAGGKDRTVRVEATREIAERAPNAEFVLYDHVGHGVRNVLPSYCLPLAGDFLRRHLA